MPVSKEKASVIALGYILNPERDSVLMLYHNASPGDPSYGKYNGLNGSMGPNESLTECMTRVILEESGCIPTHMRYRGNVHWSRFGQERESVFGHIFLIEGLDGTPRKHTPRGELQWARISELLNGDRPIWAGDEHFLPLVFDGDPRAFHGYMPYEHGIPKNWSFDRTE